MIKLKIYKAATWSNPHLPINKYSDFLLWKTARTCSHFSLHFLLKTPRLKWETRNESILFDISWFGKASKPLLWLVVTDCGMNSSWAREVYRSAQSHWAHWKLLLHEIHESFFCTVFYSMKKDVWIGWYVEQSFKNPIFQRKMFATFAYHI